ncbi:mandelate racemase/muconate lactonizing enzyme family protein [Herbiconiux sp. KACC 21604]|uniref:mandelate racemase/muconate lactonizing enzyme family protein n=1 Tax=unclassified Herbiconiux TaxID=2618217 RepID=UPI0020A239E8|nr:mandelate racemase/muconate lactonizing enzyme family protein [Herbiconiux sp. SALV-R1]WPO86902.1 mandelate racemase/muconate lactonizing enzyme family protein [Herbiconiux sp. KACC 21604]
MTAPRLASAEARLLTIPLRRPWGADVVDVRVITVDVIDSDGCAGHGFTWTPTIGGRAVLALLHDDILPFALGREIRPSLWQECWERIHEAGGGGVTTIALAGLDLALWDLRARRQSLSLPDLLGRRHDRVPAYGSGVNLHYSDQELVAQVKRWVEAGFTGVKIKVGRPELDDDLRRLAAVREVLGPDRALMIDANQRWNLDTATRAAEAVAEFDVRWLEEPLRADDLAGHVELRRRSPVPIALGENLHTRYRFRDYIDAGAVDVVQPNIVRVGGVTPFLEIASLARSREVELAPHLLPELSAQLAFTLPEAPWVEDVEDAGFGQLGALAEPSGVQIAGGWATGGPRLGLGIRFRSEETA